MTLKTHSDHAQQMKIPNISSFFVSTLLLSGCGSTTPTPLIEETRESVERISVASAQKLNIGDSATDVIKVLGSPNIITKSKDGHESWVYDRVSEQYELLQTSETDGFIFTTKTEKTKSASATKTFIVVIDFDAQNLIANIAYRFTQF
jgi:outer membrane protein assembly factor BamE (lipoprotein component of BamABCDE complex)